MDAVVGVIIPCFNQGRYVQECVESLRAQTYPNWRAVVINDASTDGESSELCERVRGSSILVSHLERNHGRALVRNCGVELLGKVDYIVNVDCDDYIEPGYLEKLLKALEENASAGLAYGTLQYFGRGTEGTVWPTSSWSRERMYLENVIPGPGTMIRSTALLSSQGWRATFTNCSGEDYDIWLQIVEMGWEPMWVNNAKYFYRQHGASFLANTKKDHQLAVALGILKHHKQHISHSIGVKSYLRSIIGPELLFALRSASLRRSAYILSVLLRCCPLDACSYVLSYYLRRILEISKLTRLASD